MIFLCFQMQTETIKYVTESGAVYFQTINFENSKLVGESWRREAKRPWGCGIDMAAYISSKMAESLNWEYDLIKEVEGEKDKREDLENMIVKGKSEGYKELGGSVVSLTSNSKLAFSNPVTKIEKVK